MALSTFDAFFKSDEEKATNGVPIPFGTNKKGDPITIWVAESGNTNHEKIQRRYSRQLEQARKNRNLYNEVIAKIVAEGVLIKWEGFLDEAGNLIEPTIENKTKMLKTYDRFMQTVLSAASDHENFAVIDPDAESDSEGN